MLALTPCDQESASSSEVHLQDSESLNLVERLATVEQMIAELHNPLVDESEAPTAHEAEAAGHPSDEDVDSVEGSAKSKNLRSPWQTPMETLTQW